MRSFGERVALNMPIQGTAADVIKLAMVNVDRRLRAEGMAARLILQVHDELIVECPEAEKERAAEALQEYRRIDHAAVGRGQQGDQVADRRAGEKADQHASENLLFHVASPPFR